MGIENISDQDLIALESGGAAIELERRGYAMGWHKPVVYAGAIYILCNPAFPKYIKIGYADDVENRIKALNRNSGLPDSFHCFAAYKVKKRLEDLQLHKLIDTLDPSLRHSEGREFFEMSPEKAYGILSAIAQINGDEKLLEKNPLHDPYFEDMPGEHETAQTVADMAQEQQPGTSGRFGRTRLTFSELGIPVGTELLFREDPQISVQTADEKSGVLYKGKVYKLSAAVATIKQDLGTATPSGAYQGGQYFLFRGATLVEWRKQLELSRMEKTGSYSEKANN